VIDDDVYRVLTPFGGVEVYFDEDSSGMRLEGAQHGIAHIKDVLSQVVGEDGRMLSVDSCDPLEFVRYGQPEWSGIKIMPPFDIVLELHRHEAGW
jgi:hypothetical protein